MIKAVKILILFTFVIGACFGQSFEGKIEYKNAYKSKVPTITDEQFTSMMGASQNYYIKGANYKSTLNGTVFLWQIYISKENKLYSKLSNSPAVLWNDASVNLDEVLKAEINKNVLKVLGYACDELILTCKSGIQKYYYSSKLKMDSKLFENFKYQNWYEFLSRANAVPLKIVMDTPQFSVESVAVNISKQKIDDAIFVLPPNTKLEKNPY